MPTPMRYPHFRDRKAKNHIPTRNKTKNSNKLIDTPLTKNIYHIFEMGRGIPFFRKMRRTVDFGNKKDIPINFHKKIIQKGLQRKSAYIILTLLSVNVSGNDYRKQDSCS